MDFYEWRDSDTESAKRFRRLLEAGEGGNPMNPEIAAKIAFDAGREEQKKATITKIAKFMMED